MKKTFLTAVFIVGAAIAAQAGGLMTNTNYHIAFDRMMARGTTFDIDAAYSNPAGLAWGREGWQLSINFQKPWQNRDITANITGIGEQKYEGKASAPIVPAIFATYKHNRWALSAMIGIVGSGGFVKYDDGVPMFNLMMQNMLSTNGLPRDSYKLDTEMKGKQYIYGGQFNFTYRIAEHFSAAAGFRVNYYDGYYRGHVIAGEHKLLGELASLKLDVDQKGWGFTPLVSLNYHKGPLTLTARYEFRTKIKTTNDTNVLDAGLTPQAIAALMVLDPLGTPAKLIELSKQLPQYTAPYEDPRWNTTSSTTRTQRWQATARKSSSEAPMSYWLAWSTISTRNSPYLVDSSAPTTDSQTITSRTPHSLATVGLSDWGVPGTSTSAFA